MPAYRWVRATAHVDAVTVLTVYVVLLLLIPSRLVFPPLGAAGTLAGLMADICILWYLFTWVTPDTTPVSSPQPLRLAIIAFSLAILASYAAAMTRDIVQLEVNGADRGLIVTAGWAGVALLAADGIRSRERLEKLFRRMVAGATFMAALGIVQYFTGLDISAYIHIPGLAVDGTFHTVLGRGGLHRPTATAIQPLEFAVVLAAILPLALHGALHAPPHTSRRRWIQVALIGTALPMTLSRTAVLAIAIMALVLLPVWPARRRHWAYATGVLFLLVLRAAAPGLIGTLRNLFTGISGDSSTQYRTGDYAAVGHYVTLHPWLGRGFGTFLPIPYRVLDNQYLLSLVETGIVGLPVLIGLLLTGWFLARSARRGSLDPEIRHLAQCVAASVAVLIVSFGTFDALGFPMAAGLTFLILGCSGALWRLTREQAPPILAPVPRELVAAGRGGG